MMDRRQFLKGSGAFLLANSFAVVRAGESATVFKTTPVIRPSKPGSCVFLHWNIGHFCKGKGAETVITAEESASKAKAFKEFFANYNPDLVGMCEYSRAFDLAGGLTKDLVLGDFSKIDEGPQDNYQCNAVALRNGKMSRRDLQYYAEHYQNTYYIAEEIEIDGLKSVFVESHLDFRRSQITELIERFKDYPRVIIAADFNVPYVDRYEPFFEAGYTAVNCSTFGTIPTHPVHDPEQTEAIDNIFVKGWKIEDVSVGDWDYELSDHRALVCALSPAEKPLVRFAVFNDVHERPALVEKIANHLEGEFDFTALNGDMIEDVRDQESVTANIITPMAFLARKFSVPCHFVRGNHEWRGEKKDQLAELMSFGEEEFYRAFTLNGVRFVLLDTFEEAKGKYEPFIERQAAENEWLKREIASSAWKKAAARIVIMHISPPVEPDKNSPALWTCTAPGLREMDDILDKSGVTLVCGAHLHYRRIDGPRDYRHYPLAVGGGSDCKCDVATCVEVHADHVTVYQIDDNGTMVDSMIFNTVSVPRTFHWTGGKA